MNGTEWTEPGQGATVAALAEVIVGARKDAMSKELAAANRYLNLMRNKAKRDYGFAYLSWLRNGAVGFVPEGKCGFMARQAVRIALAELLGDKPFDAVNL